ncbi:hypothetical protein MTR67_000646 [Solanum verrucosum]|uniref:Chromo domain-containing protein n=1 Tax=Solanum verrucosum TaxID=315347 RepID=A0AAF0PM31_SOLVR|nr:hypothetical protein MTR67_000646 [Solanum verrucosum]
MSLISARERVVKVLKDDDSFLYHPGKKDVHRLARLEVRLIDSAEGGIEVTNGTELSLVSEVEGEKDSDPIMLELQEKDVRVRSRGLGIFGRFTHEGSYEKVPVQILDRQVRKLRTKEVASVKVLWRNQFVEKATWEAEEDMKKRYPHLFESRGNVDQGAKFLLGVL